MSSEVENRDVPLAVAVAVAKFEVGPGVLQKDADAETEVANGLKTTGANPKAVGRFRSSKKLKAFMVMNMFRVVDLL
jgi:hypothetical protein